MSLLTSIANEITPSGSGVDSSRDCSHVLTFIVKRIWVVPWIDTCSRNYYGVGYLLQNGFVRRGWKNGEATLSTQISLAGNGSFGVPSSFDFYCLYVYCAVCYSRFKVDPVLEMVHLVYCPVLTFIVCMCTVQYAIAGLKATRYLKRTKSVLC